MKILRTDRLVLEPLQEAHAPELFRALVDPIVYTYLHERPPFTEDELRARYRFLEKRKSPDGGRDWFCWAIRGPGGEMHGHVSAIVHSRGAVDLGVVLTPRVWRQGIAHESLLAVMRELQLNHGASAFFMTIPPRNDLAIALAQRLGLRLVSRADFDLRAVDDGELIFVSGSLPDRSSP
jgi:RimJ/RimL family protein N-acetyltransferase